MRSAATPAHTDEQASLSVNDSIQSALAFCPDKPGKPFKDNCFNPKYELYLKLTQQFNIECILNE